MKESTVTIKGATYPTGHGKPPKKRVCHWKDFFKSMKIGQWIQMPKSMTATPYYAAREVGITIQTEKQADGSYKVWRIK